MSLLIQKDPTRAVSVSSSVSSSKTITRTRSVRKLRASENLGMNHDKSIKIILRYFKKLEIGLNKFNSKNDGVVTTNILRTVLLPFLRSKSFDKLLDELSVLSNNLKIYKSLMSILSSLLIKWWSSLLNYLISLNLSSIDRSAYLESISRIISRFEWFNKLLIDTSTSKSYDELLILTLDYAICKLANIKHLPLSISAFIGKVFAYSFFRIEGISNALFFLLNIKQSVLEDNIKNFKHIPNPSQEHLDKLYEVFPSHLHYLINYRGLPNTRSLSKHQKSLLNCLIPPRHPVKGIKDPNGLWVRRWFNSDSDIFNSFLRHYLKIINDLTLFHCLPLNDSVLFNLPGMNIILTHIYQVFNVSITRISKNNSTSRYTQDFQNIPNIAISSTSSPATNKLNPNKHNEFYYNSIFKVFRTLRDSIHQSDSPFIKSIVGYFDTILIRFAQKTSVYDFNRNSLLLNINYEFVNYLEDVDWTFWLNSCRLMIEKTDHTQVLLKTLSFLFNIWNQIPEVIAKTDQSWLNNHKSFKENYIEWLISNEIWQKLFIHWSPIVRHYYIRLLIWRVIGVNNFESSSSIKISLQVENKLKQCLEVFLEFHVINKAKHYYYKPDNPIINKKFSVVPITKDEIVMSDIPQQLSDADENDDEISKFVNPSELKKVHPFEIFDEAIYSCSTLTEEKNEDDGKRSNSLVNSIGKIFKLLTTDDKKESKDARESPREFNSGSKSVSLTSLSNYSLRSRSSSPSIMSFSSTPTSLTDLSEAASSISSSSNSDKEKSSVNPMELMNLPAELVRPAYKFELIIDQESMRDKFYLMNNKNYVFRNHDYYKLPEKAKIPSISIFLNSDSYNKFYISTDNLMLTSDDYDIEVEKGLFQNLDKVVDYMNLGKSLFEWNDMVAEFETYLTTKAEADSMNEQFNLTEKEYFKKIIPLLTLDANPKTLNAA